MFKVETHFTIRFDFKSAVILKKVLGKQSDTDRKSWGISEDGLITLHDLYDELPDDPED